jgi:hypothetical protein
MLSKSVARTQTIMLSKSVAALFLGLVGLSGVAAHATEIPDNFMVVVRESEGRNKTDSTLQATGPSTATMSDGKEVTFNMAWYEFLGDMHIRFVYDSEVTMQNLSFEEFSALNVTAEDAVAIAVKNIRRTYGKPRYEEWDEGIFIVKGESSDIDSSYFLDYSFWNDLSRKYPEGLIAAVPKRGGLIFSPMKDPKGVGALKMQVRGLYTSSGRQRVSSALYLFKDGAWSVFQAAPPEAGQ